MRLIEAEHGDAWLEPYVGLTEVDRRQSLEFANGIFVVEGITPLGRLLESAYPVRSILALKKRLPEVEALVGDRDVTVIVADPAVVEATTGYHVHRGVLAIAERLPMPTVAALATSSRLLVVLEGVKDLENLGAIARTARALGVDGMILDPTSGDPLYRRIVRVSMGEVLRLPIARSTNWPGDLSVLHDAGFTTLALTPGSDTVAIRDVAVPAKTAVVLGSEWAGLSPETMAAASLRVRIPIRAEVDSLNVGHAAAIALHHVGTGRA